MITTLLSDFSRVILNTKDRNYAGKLNELHKKLSTNPDYKFLDYYEFNQELLDFYKSLKGKLSVNIFTTGTIQNIPESREVINPIFGRVYSAIDIGFSKEDPAAYLWIAKDMNKNPNEILFIDDDLKNIVAAKEAEFITIHFENNEQAISEIKKYAEN